MNIIRRELRANLKALLIWSACVVLVLMFAAEELRALAGSAADVDALMESFPEGLRTVFGLDTIRFDKAEGYFSYIGQYLLFVASLYGGLAGVRILSREIHKKTIERALPLPITRRRFLAMKTVAALINAVIFSAITYAGVLALFSSVGAEPGFPLKVFFVIAIMFLFQVLFLFAGMTISVLTRNHKHAGSVVASAAVVIYLLSFISRLGDQMEFLTYITPFEYFSIQDVMAGKALDAFGFIVVPLMIVALGGVSFGLIKRKDIYT